MTQTRDNLVYYFQRSLARQTRSEPNRTCDTNGRGENFINSMVKIWFLAINVDFGGWNDLIFVIRSQPKIVCC